MAIGSLHYGTLSAFLIALPATLLVAYALLYLSGSSSLHSLGVLLILNKTYMETFCLVSGGITKAAQLVLPIYT